MRRVKKMASSSIVTAVFLLCCLAKGSTGSQDDCDLYAATGSNFTVPLRYKLKESESLKWFKDTSVIFYRRRKQVIEGKNDHVDSTGSLKLTQLTKDKSGRYRPEVINEDGINVGELPSVRLCVLDPVQKPNVTVRCTGDKTKVTFTCNVIKSENNFQIKWFMDDKPVAEKEISKELTRLAEDVLNARFSCNVSNPISSEISQPVQQDCIKPSDLSGIWIAVAGICICLVIILVVVICCVQSRRKKRIKKIQEEKLRLQITQEQQQHQQQL